MRTIRSYIIIIIIIIIPLNKSLLANEKNILSNSLNQFLGTKKKSIADHIYILTRCSGFFLSSSNANQQMLANSKKNKIDRDKVLFGPKSEKTNELYSYGNKLFRFLVQLKFKEKKIVNLDQKSKDELIKKVTMQVNRYKTEYTFMMFDNLKENNKIIKNNQFLVDDGFVCSGVLAQIEKIYNN